MATITGINLTADARRFLSSAPLKSFIGGKWVESASGRTMATVDPGSGEKIAEFFVMDAANVESAVRAGADAYRQSGWSKLPAEDRSVYLYRLADLIERDRDTLADVETLDSGKLRRYTGNDVQHFADSLRYFADLSIRIRYSTPVPMAHFEARSVRQPYGVCGFIIPWNAPFLLMADGITPALAAGNTVVVKPASDTPLSALYVCRLVEEAGIPDGVVNVVAGSADPTGHALAANPLLKRVSLTGSTEAGQDVAAICGRNLIPVKLELGGKGAAVVFDDVDVDDTARKLKDEITFQSGQVCCGATRWLIHERIVDDLTAAVSEKMAAVQIGHSFDNRTEMGPVVNRRQQERILSYIERGVAEGAQPVLLGGKYTVEGCEEGYYVKPALLAGSPDNIAAREEIFGPVAYISSFRSEEEAIEMANDTPYGLGNSVWSKDLDRCNRVAESMVAGNNWINGHTLGTLGVQYAGVNKSGIGGGTNSQECFFEYLRPMSIMRRQ